MGLDSFYSVLTAITETKILKQKNDAAPTEIKARLKQASTLNAIDKVAVLFFQVE